MTEASWGADPLEVQGGFRALAYDNQMSYPSSLAPNGRVSWSTHQLESSSSSGDIAEATLVVGFPEIDWQFLQSVYGWATLQYQAWARGYLTITARSARPIVFYADNVLEFWIDDDHYFGGDYYAYRRAPLVLHLDPGSHNVDIRLIRDVRVMGGSGEPKTSISMKAEISNGRLVLAGQKALIPNVINGVFASPFGFVPARNEGQKAIDILDITTNAGTVSAAIIQTLPFHLAPGQTRPLSFRLAAQSSPPILFSLEVTYIESESPDCLLSTSVSNAISTHDSHSPHKITFLHPGGIVSYAILRAPSKKATCGLSPKKRLPILLNLHGAGLEADSHQVRHMLDSVPDLPSWVLFPTGVTSWSGDDWHTWGFADVEAAVAAVICWIETVGWDGPSVDPSGWLVTGHSNGGQGTWYALTHRPDKVIGAAPVSGYSSIEGYVPYQMWAEADPGVIMFLQNSMRSFRHELLIPNFKGIPIMQQHGSADNNVPAFHSRRMNQLISQMNEDSAHRYVELKGKNHWYDGVMTTIPLLEFYDILGREADWAKLPQKFTIIIANPADMGARGGLLVDQLLSPDQLGRIEVERCPTSAIWVLRTSNILRFHFIATKHRDILPHKLVIDQRSLELPPGKEKLACWLLRSKQGSWHVSRDRQWLTEQRHGAQLGPLDSILRGGGRFLIRTSTPVSDLALQIARNLFQYFAADSEIIDLSAAVGSQSGNVISLTLGSDSPMLRPHSDSFGIDKEGGLYIRRRGGIKTIFPFEVGMGAIFLRPLLDERLELVIWGFDKQGLRQAARLMPILTGVGQPDFVVVSKRCAWEGAGGVLAIGSFDNCWNVSEASFVC